MSFQNLINLTLVEKQTFKMKNCTIQQNDFTFQTPHTDYQVIENNKTTYKHLQVTFSGCDSNENTHTLPMYIDLPSASSLSSGVIATGLAARTRTCVTTIHPYTITAILV